MEFLLTKYGPYPRLSSTHAVNMHKLDHQLSHYSRAPPNAEKCVWHDPLVFHARLNLPIAQNPLLPVTVQDQIRLWELERNRLKSQEGMNLTRDLMKFD